jgi:hypothetical protein
VKTLTSLILSIALLIASCCVAFATEYYIATTGNDSTGDGTIGTPWLTLAKACTSVAAGSHTINVAAGTYTETAKCTLAAGVSIKGVTTGVTDRGLGQTSILELGYDPTTVHGWIELKGAAEGENGNQSISYVKLDGKLRVNSNNRYFGVYVAGRKNVKIHHVHMVDHYRQGLVFEGRIDQAASAPTTYATGNELYNSTVANSGKYYGGTGRGCVNIGGQDGLLIHDNVLTQTGRDPGENGYVIKFFDNGYLKNTKIYNNTITKAPYDGSTFQFSIELWNLLDGNEIYNNVAVGSFDLCYMGADPSTGYSVKVYGNTIGTATKQSQAESGIQLEDGGDDIYIYNNLFKNLNKGIRIQQDNAANFTFDGIHIYNNVFAGVGYTGGTSDGKNGTGISMSSSINGGTWTNFYIYNNTFYTSYAEGFYGIVVPGVGTGTNWYVKNNIIKGFATAPIYSFMETADSTIDVLDIRYNDMHGNGNSNAYLASGITATNLTNSNHITTDPLIDTAYTFGYPTLSSPAIGAGVDLSGAGITTDKRGKSRPATPSIGAFEFSQGIDIN